MDNQKKEIQITDYKVVVFDIDGTMYHQKKLRLMMLFELMIYYILRPHKLFELKIIKLFREEREKRKGYQSNDLETEQYKWVSDITKYSIQEIKKVISKWIYIKPLKYLEKSKYVYLDNLLKILKEKGIKVCVYSDYPTKEKLKALNLPIKINLEVSSIDEEINSFKPSGKGLQYIINRLGIKKNEVLFIGDRMETDGECAKNAGVDFVIIDKKGKIYKELIEKIN